jgi:23S rRNA pseudouridine1911/1915/1917 synthase
VSESRKKGLRRAAGPPQPAAPTLAARVRELAPGTSWEQARALCRAGRIWVDGRPATDPAWRPGGGCRVELVAAAAVHARQAGPAAWGKAGRPAEGGAGEGKREEAPEARLPPAPALVAYADADLVVVRKPPGVLTVPFDRGDRDTLLALTRVALRRLESRRPGGAGPPRAGAASAPAHARSRTGGAAVANPTLRAVQRLDKDTSGLVVFARSVAIQRALQQQLARGAVTRRYLALAHGAARAATHDTWLVADRGDGLRGSWGARAPGGSAGAASHGRGRLTAVARRHSSEGAGRRMPRVDMRHSPEGSPGRSLPPPGSRQAVTHVRVVATLRGATLVSCELETGRQHQVRIHLAEAGHPLVGETVYIRDYRGPRLPAPRLMLHAAALGFRHPRDGRPLFFEEPPPADFAAVLRRLGSRGGKPSPPPRGIEKRVQATTDEEAE